MTMNEKRTLQLKLIIIFFMMLAFSFANLGGNIRPFAISLFLGLVFGGLNILYACPMYIAASLLARPTLDSLLEIMGAVLVLIIVAAIRSRTKKPLPIRAAGFIGLLSQIGYIYLAISTKSGAVEAVINLTLGIVFSYIFLVFSKRLLSSSKNRLTQIELICAALTLSVVALGVSSASSYGVYVARAMLVFLTLFFIHSLGASYGVRAALTFSLGIALKTGDASVIGIAALAALSCSMFYKMNRAFAVVGVMLSEASCALYFMYSEQYIIMNLIWLAIGCAVFWAVPKRLYPLLSVRIKGESSLEMELALTQDLKKNIANSLYSISNAYRDIDDILKNLNAAPKPNDEIERTASMLPKKLCNGCKNFLSCHKDMRHETSECFESVCRSAFERGKASITIIPQYLTAKCPRLDIMLQLINDSMSENSFRKRLVALKDEQRELFGLQMSGVSSALNALENKLRKNVRLNTLLAESVEQELMYLGYEPKHVRITETSLGLDSVSVVMKKDSITQTTLLNELDRILKCRLAVMSIAYSHDGQFEEFTFETQPPFDLTYGVRNTQKWGTSKSGDTHSIIKLDRDKVMLAICDGMGSGESAESFSANTIALIESLYRAGLESPKVLALANKILCLDSDEIFSAIDICIIDLTKGTADFIKLGSSYGMIKTQNGIETVSAGSLPLGILDTVRPVVCTYKLSDGDIVVLSSDGITDVFESPSQYARLLEDNKVLNPSALSKKILDYAVSIDSQMPHDDMTVLAVRIIK